MEIGHLLLEPTSLFSIRKEWRTSCFMEGVAALEIAALERGGREMKTKLFAVLLWRELLYSPRREL